MLAVPHTLLMLLTSTVGSGALAVVLFTFAIRIALLPLSLRAYRAERQRARLAPRLAELRKRHEDDPATLARESIGAMRAGGTGPFAGLLPTLAQAPAFIMLYRLFTASTVDGAPNGLMRHSLLGTGLGTRLDPALPVWWLLLVCLAAVAWWAARQVPASAPRPVRLLPFGTVVFAGFVPLAAGLYLLASGLWTAVERALLRRPRAAGRRHPHARRRLPGSVGTAEANT